MNRIQKETMMVQEVASRHQGEFGLRAFPGKRFRVDVADSFVAGDGTVQLYIHSYDEKLGWGAFSKATESELIRNKTNRY